MRHRDKIVTIAQGEAGTKLAQSVNYVLCFTFSMWQGNTL